MDDRDVSPQLETPASLKEWGVVLDPKNLHREESGVQWYVLDLPEINYMVFDDRVISGHWAGPSWVFWALSMMTPEQRLNDGTHDGCMGAITARISQYKEEGLQTPCKNT
jgi:hypothetical protein